MLKKLKAILNSYTDEELEKMDLWVNSTECAIAMLVDDNDIDLITKEIYLTKMLLNFYLKCY